MSTKLSLSRLGLVNFRPTLTIFAKNFNEIFLIFKIFKGKIKVSAAQVLSYQAHSQPIRKFWKTFQSVEEYLYRSIEYIFNIFFQNLFVKMTWYKFQKICTGPNVIIHITVFSNNIKIFFLFFSKKNTLMGWQIKICAKFPKNQVRTWKKPHNRADYEGTN